MHTTTFVTVKNSNFKNPRWRMAAILKTIKLPYICNCLTDFDKIWHDDALSLPHSRQTVKILNYWKFNILKITKIAISRQQLIDRSSRNLAWWCKMDVLNIQNLRICKIQDVGRTPFWKPLNRHICATIWLTLMKFGTVTHIGSLQWIDCWNLEFVKIQDGSGHHHENHKNCNFLSMDWLIITKFGTLMQNGSLNRPDC